jgi:phage terminase large subunit-like protein
VSAVAEKPRRKKGAAAPPPPAPWWGGGEPPWALWPGVSLRIDAVWVAARSRWESPDGEYYFDPTAADRAVGFFPDLLTHHIGEFAGQPFELLDYQKKLLTRPIFGWKRASDGLRRFRKVFAFLPKGAGKSPWGSGTGLYCTLMDDEPAAEVYAVAADKNQARVVHENAKIMVEQSPDLAELLEVLKDSIYDPETRSTYQVLSSDASTKHGFRPHVVIFDEMHAQPNRDLYEALKKSMVKRRQPLMLIITHSGDDDEGICYEEYEYAKAVLAGNVDDPTCLPVIFEAKPDDDWTSPEVWRRVNPGHGITVKTDGIAAECVEAQHEPRKLNDFLRYHLNRWVNDAVAWIPGDWWDGCVDPLPSDEELGKLTVAAGLDLAQKWDLACFGLTFRERLAQAVTVDVVAEDEPGVVVKRQVQLNYRIAVVPYFWIPEDTMREHEKRDKVPYSQWVQAGLVTATDGAVIDYDRIFRDIREKVLPRFPRLKQGLIGYDPAFATDLATALRDKAGLKVKEVLQNYTHMSEPAHIFEALVKGQRVVHGGHRVLRNHVEHVAVKRDDAGRLKPVRPKRAGKHIDGVVATLMGLKALAELPDRSRRGIGAFVV